MPTASPSGPTLVSGSATTGAGRALVRDDLTKAMKKAFIALLIVAILQTLGGPVMLMVEKSKLETANPGMTYQIQPYMYVIVFGIAALFWGLAIWARRNPLPAAIVGLVTFITLHAIEAVADPTSIIRGIIMKVLVIGMLVSAIKAGIEFRKLKEASTP